MIFPELQSKAGVDNAKVALILNQLAGLLESNDTDAYDLFEEHKDLLLLAFGNSGHHFERQIHEFDYRDALTTLRSVFSEMLEDF